MARNFCGQQVALCSVQADLISFVEVKRGSRGKH